MSCFAKQYRKSPGEAGTFVIEETGLCMVEDVALVEHGCTKRYKMVALPQSAGAIMKVLDGTNPAVIQIKASTYTEPYMCVKVLGQVDPYAAPQDGGPLRDKAVLSYVIRYQQVGGVA